MTDFLFNIAGPIAYLIVFGLLVLCGMGNPLPEDTILIAAGYLAYTEVVRIPIILPICYFGILAGDIILYMVGRKYGQKLIEHPRLLKLIPIHRIDKIRRGFQRWGHWMIFFARFLVGFRSPTFLLSGVMKIRFREFLLIDALGGLISVPLFVGLGYVFGEQVDSLRHDIHRIQSWVIAGVVLLVAIFVLYRWLRSRKAEADLEAIFLWEPHLHRSRDEEDSRSKEKDPRSI